MKLMAQVLNARIKSDEELLGEACARVEQFVSWSMQQERQSRFRAMPFKKRCKLRAMGYRP